MRYRTTLVRSWLFLAILAGFGASDPELLKVRVPASKVQGWFPAGTDLETLTTDRFEELVKAARANPSTKPTPKIIRARHHAKLEGEILSGSTELTIESIPAARESLILVEPWSPALEPSIEESRRFRATADGRLAIKIGATGPKVIKTDWRLRARPGSGGRAFPLSLPDVEIASLTIDLPAGWVPETRTVARVGNPADLAAGRSIWKFESVRGELDLRIRIPGEASGKPGSAGLWLEGPTRIDLTQSPNNWQADWILTETPGAPSELAIELDGGLELVEVLGPRVASFKETTSGKTTRVLIRLDGNPSGSSPLTIKAIARVPAEGPWIIPSAKPIDAVWTGGRTYVWLDSSRVLQSCVAGSGRPASPLPLEKSEPNALIFEGTGEPGPLAELTLRKPTSDATIDIRGQLILGAEAPRIEAVLTWTAERGRLLTHSVELAPGWVPDRVLSSDKQQVPWHSEAMGSGVTRVYIGPGLPDENTSMLSLTLTARAPKAGVVGLLDLPRIRPVSGVRVIDEIWVATASRDLNLRPIKGEGLAWIDPLDPPLDDAPSPWVASDLEEAMAWRWLADDAEGRISRTRITNVPRAEINLDASIVDRRLNLSWSVSIDLERGAIRAIPVHLDVDLDRPIRWEVRDTKGSIVEARPMDLARRSKLGLSATGSAWDLEFIGVSEGRVELVGSAQVSSEAPSRIPILTLPNSFRYHGLVNVYVKDSTRVDFSPRGLVRLDASTETIKLAASKTQSNELDRPLTRRAALFAYRSGGGSLELKSVVEAPNLAQGLIREACLVSQIFPDEGIRHRLTLRCVGVSGGNVDLEMPSGSRLDHVRRDGQPVRPLQFDRGFRVEFSDATNARQDSTLTIDYRSEIVVGETTIAPSHFLPSCSIPCLSFVWEVVTPESWSLSDDIKALVTTEPRSSRSFASKFLGFSSDPWAVLKRGRSISQANDAVMLAELDRLAGEFKGTEARLGDWLLNLDSGPWPILVDRLALRSLGWGPSSRIAVATPEVISLGPVQGVLQPLGLNLTPIGGQYLISNRQVISDCRNDRAAWSGWMNRVATNDQDGSDRFESVADWRGEATPRAVSSGEPLDRSIGPVGWRSTRLISTGWPPTEASIRLIDRSSRHVTGWVMTLVVLALGAISRKQPSKHRAIVVVLVGILTTLSLGWTWPEPPTLLTGLLRGILGTVALWIGSSLRRGHNSSGAEVVDGSTRVQRNRPSRLVGGTMTLILVFAGSAGFGTQVERGAANPILALLVFDGVPDAVSKPDRVLMSLQDSARLRSLAEPREATRPPSVSATSASHRVIRPEPKLARIESRFELEVETGGVGVARWTMPIGNARDLEATVDGRAAPLRITPDGSLADVALEGTGRHLVILRRFVSLDDCDSVGERFQIPINRCAFARVSVDRTIEGSQVLIPSAFGKLEANSSGLEGGLGPTDRLDIRWYPANWSPAPGLRGPIEATVLWDARPVGDLIRLRMTHSEPEGASTIRLSLEPGLIVRQHSIPNVVDIIHEGPAEHPEWVAKVDPPLPRDVPIEINLWRSVTPGSGLRRYPTFAIHSTGKINQMIGFRHPFDWSGRLEPSQGAEAVSDASFLKLWGSLVDQNRVLAGAVRFSSFSFSPTLAVSMRPLPLRRSIESKVQLDLGAGRIGVLIESTLLDVQGQSFELESIVPPDLRIIRVEATGLADWQRRGRDRLRLQFDGTEVPRRQLRIEGYLAAVPDPVMSEVRSYQVNFACPHWIDEGPLTTTLIVSSPTRPQIEMAKGLKILSSSGPALNPVTGFRSTFGVDRAAGVSTIRWAAPIARLGVSVRSDLTIVPDAIDWTAVVQCEIAGGPADSLQWDLPTEWAKNARLELEGNTFRLASEPKGETTRWTIQPETRLWGRARLILRSSQPIKPGQPLTYPELVPLAVPGRGSVQLYEATIANSSGRELNVQGLAGVQELDPSSIREADSIVPSRSFDRAFRITGGKWSVGLVIGRAGESVGPSFESQTTDVADAMISVIVGENREQWGLARYELKDHPGPFLSLQFSGSVEIPWTLVDGISQPVVREGGDRWLVPLGDQRPRRVLVVWHRPGTKPGMRAPEVIELPGLAKPMVPTLITIHHPSRLNLVPKNTSLESIDQDAVEIESAEWKSADMLARLSRIELGATAERESFVEDLVDLELKVRALRRRKTGPVADRMKAALTRVEEACENSGLEDLYQKAQANLGLGGEPEETTKASSNPSEPVRVRRVVGVATRFRSRSNGGAESIAFELKPAADRTKFELPDRWLILGLGSTISLMLAIWFSKPRGFPGRLIRILVLVGLCGSFAFDPLVVSGFLIGAFVGYGAPS